MCKPPKKGRESGDLEHQSCLGCCVVKKARITLLGVVSLNWVVKKG